MRSWLDKKGTVETRRKPGKTGGVYRLFHGSRREKKYGLAFGFRETAFLFQLFKISFGFGLQG